MTPSHTVKKGVRYRYYVSSAILHKQPDSAGSVCRVPAAEIEELVSETLRRHCDEQAHSMIYTGDQGLPHLERVVIKLKEVEVHISMSLTNCEDGQEQNPIVVSLPWAPQKFVAVKGVSRAHLSEAPRLKPDTRDALLTAIAKARGWMSDMIADRITISEIASQEGNGERHIRLLLPLAFTAPAVVEAISNGSVPAGTTVTGLANSLPHSWAEQARIPV
ncbi:MAG: hypothetical protein ABI450_02525 [Rhizomicrobium sp.]